MDHFDEVKQLFYYLSFCQLDDIGCNLGSGAHVRERPERLHDQVYILIRTVLFFAVTNRLARGYFPREHRFIRVILGHYCVLVSHNFDVRSDEVVHDESMRRFESLAEFDGYLV